MTMVYRLAGFALIDLAIGAALVAALVELDSAITSTLWVLAVILAVAGVIELGLAWYLFPRARSDEELERYGRPAEATVLDVKDRGVSSTGEQHAELRLLVEPANERPFTAQRRVTLPAVPEIGEQVRVKFDPNRRRRVIVLG